ncbi:hypothetical protein ACS5PN_03780 [Roseateles sp. NT4]|uniref:hypothetical protein n=1 Tax=Roseateles sp. NT4 TaxID=3453715 RepID=UPI003EE92F3C
MRPAAQGGLGALHLVDGLAVSDRWFAPGEGPFTVLAKIARANVLDARGLCRHFGVSMPQAPANAPHRRSLLHLGWLARGETTRELFAQLWERGLLARSERWSHALASDRTLRYCPRCLSMGYQSALCQIDGLAHCPTHGDELLDRCQACGASTPPYAITPEAFDEPLVCARCRQPLAPIWGHGGGLRLRVGIEEQPAYRRLDRWLERADRLEIEWMDQPSWLGDPRAPLLAGKVHKRVHTAGVLSALVSLPGQLLGEDSWMGSWSIPAACPPQLAPDKPVTCAARVAIYKSIRRQYARRFGARVGGTAHSDRHKLVWSNDHAMAMPTGEGGDPSRHGFLAWRLRFEEPSNRLGALRSEETSNGQGTYRRLKLFDALLLWPVDWLAPDAAWGHFAHRCLLLDLAMARALARAMTGLDYQREQDRATWLEVVSLWHHRFGSHARVWPDGLTTFKTAGAEGTPGRIHLVAAPSVVSISGAPHEL